MKRSCLSALALFLLLCPSASAERKRVEAYMPNWINLAEFANGIEYDNGVLNPVKPSAGSKGAPCSGYI